MPARSINVRFWGFGAHLMILQAFLASLRSYPHTYPPVQQNSGHRFNISTAQYSASNTIGTTSAT